MAKLFSDILPSMEEEQLEEETTLDSLNPEEEIDDSVASMDMAIECIKTSFERISYSESIMTSLEEKTLLSPEYAVSLENLHNYVESISDKLGVQKKIPSLEDFTNNYTAKVAQEVAMEGIKEFIKNIWTKIKNFFKEFWKKMVLFYKRIMKSNLDLVSYEKYVEQLIAKLKANDAKLESPKEISTKLVELLSDPSTTNVDSDFILQIGSSKIDRLTELANRIGTNSSSQLTRSDLFPKLRNKVETLSNKYKDTSKEIDLNELQKEVKEIRDTGASIIRNIFTVELKDPKYLPDKVFDRVNEIYSSAELRGGEFQVLALNAVDDPYNSLPKNANIFLTQVNGSNYYIAGFIDDSNRSIPANVKPISNLDNLTKFYNKYKEFSKKVDIKTTNNNIDKVNSEINKSLEVLENRFSTTADNIKVRLGIDDPWETLCEITKEAYNKHLSGLEGNEYDSKVEDMEEGLGELSEYIGEKVGGRANNYTDYTAISQLPIIIFKKHDIDNLNDHLGMFNKFLNYTRESNKMSIDELLQLTAKTLGVSYILQADNEQNDKVKEAFSELNKYLVNLLTMIQTLFRNIASNVYGVYAELRYAMIKYIYDSAQQYSY